MTTASFSLLKLPLIPLELIIEQLDFVVLLQFSMKSSRFKHFLELLKLSVSTLRLCLTKRSYGISVLRNCKTSYIDVYGTVLVGTTSDEAVHCWENDGGEVTVKSDLSKLATLETITKYILSICKVANYALTYDDAKTGIRSLFIWQLATIWDQLQIYRIGGDLVQISSEDLTFILENISVECLNLNVRCPGFNYQKPLKHTSIHISRPRWIDFDKFSLGPETITANFYEQKVSNAVVNRLIKDWTEGKNPKLRAVKFEWEEYDQESLAMAREHEARPPRPILPNQNIKQLKGLSINHRMKHRFWRQSVFYKIHLSVEEYFGLNGIHLEDQA